MVCYWRLVFFLIVVSPWSVSADEWQYLESLYLHLHQNPELSFHEEKSSRRMAAELAQLDFEVTENVGGFGVVGVFENGPGPVILIRADMDGLPVQELTGASYASTATTINDLGIQVSLMHACGHDVHMTVFVGTARKLVKDRANWSGTLVMIAQPAEERGGGASAMLNDGLFERFPRPDVNLALHVSAELPAGQIGLVSGFSMANVDSVDVQLYGIGGHGAYPHMTKDPIVLAALIINSLQTLVSREISPLESAVVTVGSIHGGTKHNVIPAEVKLQLTVRSYSDDTRNKLLNGIARIAREQAKVLGFPENIMPDVTVQDEYTPAVYNDPTLVAQAHKWFNELEVVNVEPVMAGEDFARYRRVDPEIPSLLIWLGAVDPAIIAPEKSLPSLHSALFLPLAEPTIKTGVTAMTTLATNLFNQ